MAIPTQTITQRTGRQYLIEANDTLYAQRLQGTLHYQVTNLTFTWDILKRLARPIRTVIDCGMNVGMNTVEYGTFADTVHGFEPTPEIHDLARRNIEHNRLNWDDDRDYMFDWSRRITAEIHTHQVALSNQRHTVKMISHPRNRGHNHIYNGVRKTEKDMYEVETKLMDDYDFNAVDFIKMDTEGHELPILEGATRTIDQSRPTVQIEIVPDQCRRYQYTPQDIWQYFRHRDYRCYTRDHIDRTEGCEMRHKQGGRYRMYHNGEEIVRQMDYWFVPQEHPFVKDDPRNFLFD